MSATTVPLGSLKQPPGYKITKLVGVSLILFAVASITASSLGFVWFVVPSQAQGGLQSPMVSLLVCVAILAVLVASGIAFVVGAVKGLSAGDVP